QTDGGGSLTSQQCHRDIPSTVPRLHQQDGRTEILRRQARLWRADRADRRYEGVDTAVDLGCREWQLAAGDLAAVRGDGQSGWLISPSALVGEGAVAKRRRMRGLSPRREPLIRRFAPPSPTRGEGKSKLRRVVRLFAVQHPLQRIEMPLGRRRSFVEMLVLVIALGFLHHGGRKLLQLLPGPHRIDL